MNDPETMAFTGELSKLCWGIVTSDQVNFVNWDKVSFFTRHSDKEEELLTRKCTFSGQSPEVSPSK